MDKYSGKQWTGAWHGVEEMIGLGGVLTIDGCSTVDLIRDFGSPLYVYSETRLRKNYQRLVKAFERHYSNYSLYYTVKANNNPAVVAVLASDGAGADCSCIGEIQVAQKVGISNKRLLYTGPFPSLSILQEAVDSGAVINLDNSNDIERLERVGVPELLSFRINPGRGSSGKEGLVFAGPDAKFGISADDAEDAYRRARDLGVERFGVHMMTGSNILDPNYFSEIVEQLLDIIGPIVQKLGISLEFIDIGGGLGVPYHPEQQELDVDALAQGVVSTLRRKLEQYSLGEPTLIQEPGRYIASDAGVLLTTISSIKRTTKTFVGVDAGMNTLLRPAIYDAYHHIVPASNLDATCDTPCNIVGPICENTDQFAKDFLLPSTLGDGDILAILNTGAYGFSMSSQYNTQPRAAEVLVCNGEATVIRERETIEDVFAGTSVPRRLQRATADSIN